jgi:hypothetical protein
VTSDAALDFAESFVIQKVIADVLAAAVGDGLTLTRRF